MQIHKHPNETEEQFRTRAFRWNRLVGEAFARRQARYSATPATAEKLQTRTKLVECGDQLLVVPADTGATRINAPLGMPHQPVSRMSRVRAAWYGSGLVGAVALVAVAVMVLPG
jgi:hypothetical protein